MKVKVKDVKRMGETAEVFVEAEDGRGFTLYCGVDVASDKKALADLIKQHVRMLWNEQAEIEEPEIEE